MASVPGKLRFQNQRIGLDLYQICHGKVCCFQSGTGLIPDTVLGDMWNNVGNFGKSFPNLLQPLSSLFFDTSNI